MRWILKTLYLLIKVLILMTLAFLMIDCLPDPSYLTSTSTTNPVGFLSDSPLHPVRDVFYGISTAAPGTFARMMQKWFLKMMSSTTTTAMTTPVTTAMPSMASSAAAIGAGTMAGVGAGVLIVAFVYTVLKIASLVTGGGW